MAYEHQGSQFSSGEMEPHLTGTLLRNLERLDTNDDALSSGNGPDSHISSDVNIVTSYIPPIGESALKEEQQKDEELRSIVEGLTADPRLTQNYKLNDQGVLCWVPGEPGCDRLLFSNNRSVVPGSMILEVMKTFPYTRIRDILAPRKPVKDRMGVPLG